MGDRSPGISSNRSSEDSAVHPSPPFRKDRQSPGKAPAGDAVHPRLRWSLLVGTAALGLGLLLAGACRERQRDPTAPRPEPAPVAQVRPEAPTPAVTARPPSPPPAPAVRTLPTITAEPSVGVLLARAASVEVQLLRPGRDGGGRAWPAGTMAAAVSGGRLLVAGQAIPGGELRLDFPPGAPGYRHGQRELAGALRLRLERDRVLLIEQEGLETYLTGVLAKEVQSTWPLEALKAQAVAARSYAAARYLTRHDQPWQLDASEQVDMAYAGHVAQVHPNLATALAQTRGQLLWYREQPLPAFFHAASGGHGEAVDAVWPERRTPDGKHELIAAMPAVRDPWDAAGRAVAAQRLGPWKASLPLDELRRLLVAAGQRDPGAIRAVRLVGKDPTSGRARQVRIDGASGAIELSGHQLRMALGSQRIRSTLWRDFRLDAGQLIVQGHGYGHGVGLPQASAWAMAKAGRPAGEMLRLYYPGAALVRRW